MFSSHTLKKLIALANSLDKKGLYSIANELDNITKQLSKDNIYLDIDVNDIENIFKFFEGMLEDLTQEVIDAVVHMQAIENTYPNKPSEIFANISSKKRSPLISEYAVTLTGTVYDFPETSFNMLKNKLVNQPVAKVTLEVVSSNHIIVTYEGLFNASARGKPDPTILTKDIEDQSFDGLVKQLASESLKNLLKKKLNNSINNGYDRLLGEHGEKYRRLEYEKRKK